MPNYRKGRVMLKVLDPAEARSVKVPGGTPSASLIAPSTVREVFDAYYVSERFQRKSNASRGRQLDNASALIRQHGDRTFDQLPDSLIKGFVWGHVANRGGKQRRGDSYPICHKQTIIGELCRFARDIGAGSHKELSRIYSVAEFDRPLGRSPNRNGIQPCVAVRPPDLKASPEAPKPEPEHVQEVDPPKATVKTSVSRSQLRGIRAQLMAMREQNTALIEQIDAMGLSLSEDNGEN